MFFFKNLGVMTALAVVLVGSAALVTSCRDAGESSPSASTPDVGGMTGWHVRDAAPLAEQPALTTTLRGSALMARLAPSYVPDFADATVFTYTDDESKMIDTKVVAVPLGGNSTLVAYLSEAGIGGFVLDIESLDGHISGDVTGTMLALNPETGAIVSGGRYEAGKLVEVIEGSNLDGSPMTEGWLTFTICLRNVWRFLPGWVRFFCGSMIVDCLAGNRTACAWSIGCAAGYLAVCSPLLFVGP